jgi:hypothetical protein
MASDLPLNKPPYRKLRGYAFDPVSSLNMETAEISHITYKVPWEDNLQKGPEGEYIKVIDRDPASNAVYRTVTASKSGLDLVQEKDLIAFMPLVQDKVPKECGGAKNFPAQELYGVLIEKTKGRIVRTDEGNITDERAEKLRSLLSAKERKAFVEGVVKGDCYFEYAING